MGCPRLTPEYRSVIIWALQFPSGVEDSVVATCNDAWCAAVRTGEGLLRRHMVQQAERKGSDTLKALDIVQARPDPKPLREIL